MNPEIRRASASSASFTNRSASWRAAAPERTHGARATALSGKRTSSCAASSAASSSFLPRGAGDRGFEGPAHVLTRLREPTRQLLHTRDATIVRPGLVAQARGLVELAGCQRRLREHDQDLGRRGAVEASKVPARALLSPGARRRERKRELHFGGRLRLAREAIAELERLLIGREVIDQEHEERPRCRRCAARVSRKRGSGSCARAHSRTPQSPGDPVRSTPQWGKRPLARHWKPQA
jgi:hypothetical protein